MRNPISVVAASLTALFVAAPAHAALLGGTANFSEALDVPFFRHAGPLVLGVTGAAINGSTELTSANLISNPSNDSNNVLAATLGDTTLTLAAPVFQDWQTITFTVSNIVFLQSEAITGFSLVSAGAISTGGDFASDPFTTTTSFTANSLTVTYAVNSIDTGDEFYFSSNSAPDVFAITVESIPEPASIGVLAMGLAGMIVTRRRAKPSITRR